jgi:hypothetical protein
MRLDAEEEAARGAVEHLLKTLESDAAGAPPPPLGKLPAHDADAPPVGPKGNHISRLPLASSPIEQRRVALTNPFC